MRPLNLKDRLHRLWELLVIRYVLITGKGRRRREWIHYRRSMGGRKLHQVWRDKLGNVAARILDPLLDAYPDSIEAAVVAELAGYHPNAKSFANMKGRLRTLGLIGYPAPGQMAATKVLFPEGLV